MEEIKNQIKTLIDLMGLKDAKISIDETYRKISIFIDDELVQSQAASVLSAFEHIIGLICRKYNTPTFIVDVNYYRKERERLITELARAAAHKARVTKKEVELPHMNAYERRIVHMEIAVHPELKTESIGAGKDRRVIIKHIDFSSVDSR